jgi:hypothetical protein
MNKHLMYPCISALILLFLTIIPLEAQKVELIPFAGYETGAKATAVTDGVFHLDGGFLYGGAVGFKILDSYKLEISYGHMGSDMTYTLEPDVQDLGRYGVTYITIGGIYEYNPEDTWVPFGKLALGTIIYNPDNEGSSTERIGHFNISGGVKYFVNDHIGLRLQAAVILPLFFEGFYFSDDVNTDGTGMPTEISMVQGEITTGMVFRF